MANTVQIVLEIDDKGSAKIKQFGEATRKSFEDAKKGAEQGKATFNSLSESFVGIITKVGIATAAIYGIKRTFIDMAIQIAAATNEIEKQSKLIGMSTDTFQKWAYAARMSDVQSQEFSFGLRLLSRNMEDASAGTGDAAKYFTAMGVSVKDAAGHLRPLNDVMLDIMDKFAEWEDGPRKIAISLALFGRGGEALIPLLNKGRDGFRDFATEAQKLGVVLSPELVRKGSEAEDGFKKLSAQWEATKNSFAGASKAIAEGMEPVLAIINLIGAGIGKIKDFSDAIEKLKYKTGLGSIEYEKRLDTAEMERETAEYYRNIQKVKTPPPKLGMSEQVRIDLDYQAKYFELVNDRISALRKEKEKAIEEAKEKGLKTFEIEKYYNEAIRRERETLDIGRKGAIAESAAEEAKLLGNIDLIEKAEKSVFELRLNALRLQKEYTPELEKQLRATFSLEQSERRRAANAELMKYPAYEAPDNKWETEGLKLLDERKKAVIDLSAEYASLTGDLEGQIRASKELEAVEIRRIERELGADADLIEKTKELGEAKRQQMIWESQQRTAELMTGVQRAYGELSGDYGLMKQAEIDLLELEKNRVIVENHLTGIYRDQVEQLYAMKEAEVEARKNMDAIGLSVIGWRKYTIETKNQLADTFENFLPNVMKSFWDTFEEGLKKGEWSWKSFGDSLKRIWANMVRKMLESFTNDLLNGAVNGLGKLLGMSGGGPGTTYQGAGGSGGFGAVIGGISAIGGAIGGLFKSSSPSWNASPGGYSMKESNFYSGINYGYSATQWHEGKGPGEISSLTRFLPRFHEGVGPDEVLSVIRKDESVLTPAQMKAVASNRPNQSISVGPIEITLASAKEINPATLKKTIDKAIVEALRDFS